MTLAISTSESVLVNLIKDRDRAGFDFLYDRYAGQLYGIIRKITGDEKASVELLEETFVKIWKEIWQYDPGKAGLQTWMIRIARDISVAHVKKAARSQTAYPIAHKPILTVEAEKTSGKNLRNLEEPQRQVLDALFFGGYNCDEASALLNISATTLKTRAREALKTLRGEL